MKQFIVTLFFYFLLLVCFSQNSKTYSIDLYSSDKTAGIFPLYLQGNIRIIENISAGIYLSYSQTESNDFNYITQAIEGYTANNLGAGIAARYFLFCKDMRLMPYLSGRIGLIRTTSKYPTFDVVSTQIDYGLYAGARFNVFKSFHVFTELGYGKYDFIRLGISLDI